MLTKRPAPDVNYIVEIKFDVDKIEDIGEYTFESIHDAALNSFLNTGLGYFTTNDGSILVHDVNENDDYCKLLSTAIDLYAQKWFRDYVKEYYFYNFDELDDVDETGEFEVENIIEELVASNKKLGIVYE